MLFVAWFLTETTCPTTVIYGTGQNAVLTICCEDGSHLSDLHIVDLEFGVGVSLRRAQELLDSDWSKRVLYTLPLEKHKDLHILHLATTYPGCTGRAVETTW